MAGNRGMYGNPTRKLTWSLVWDEKDGTFAAESIGRYAANHDHVFHKIYFATVRPAHNGEGLMDSTRGYVVTRNEFDDLRVFATLDEAKLYVESIYELERKD